VASSTAGADLVSARQHRPREPRLRTTGREVQSGSTRPRTSVLWASIERILTTSDSSYRIAGLKRKMAAFRTSFAMEELEIQLQMDRPWPDVQGLHLAST
jgi:hypothetical protein